MTPANSRTPDRRSSLVFSQQIMLALAAFTGCGHARAPGASRAAVTASAGSRCAIAPMRLMLAPPNQPPTAMATLAADGAVAFGPLGDGQPVARLDARGCLVGRGDTWVEVTSRGDVWSAHDTLRLRSDGALQLASGRSIRIEADGAVRTFDAAGALEPETYGRMFVEGFTESSRCAAHALLATFLAAMPSMAVSDGHPRAEPAPSDSVCPHATASDASTP